MVSSEPSNAEQVDVELLGGAAIDPWQELPHRVAGRHRDFPPGSVQASGRQLLHHRMLGVQQQIRRVRPGPALPREPPDLARQFGHDQTERVAGRSRAPGRHLACTLGEQMHQQQRRVGVVTAVPRRQPHQRADQPIGHARVATAAQPDRQIGQRTNAGQRRLTAPPTLKRTLAVEPRQQDRPVASRRRNPSEHQTPRTRSRRDISNFRIRVSGWSVPCQCSCEYRSVLPRARSQGQCGVTGNTDETGSFRLCWWRQATVGRAEAVRHNGAEGRQMRPGRRSPESADDAAGVAASSRRAWP